MEKEDADPFYTTLCSSVTLQSNKKGFFLDYAEYVHETLGNKWLNNTFARLKTDEDRIKVCYRDPKVREVVHGTLQHVQELYRPKAAASSRQKRLEGSRALNAGKAREALMLYSQSIIRAPKQGVDMMVDNGLSLALGLAARSEALLELQEYETCISDIQQAMKEGFPEHRRFQLYWRMGRCYRDMGQIAKARVSMQLALKILTKHQAEIGKESTSYAKTVEQELDSLSSPQENSKLKEKKIETYKPLLTGDANSELPAASQNINITSSEEAGRFAVASAPISTGDTLVVEEPYAACLLTDMFGSHCQNCLQRFQAPVACPDCSGLAFCSVSCRDRACASYHKYECRFMDLLIGSGMSVLCHVALRMVTQSEFSYFHRVKGELKSPPGQKVSTDSYAAVYGLVTHAGKRTAQDFLHRTLMAIFLLKCLQRGGYFPKPSTDVSNLNEEELFIGSLLLHHLQLLQFNAHEIFETKIEAPGKFRSARQIYIGVGIYPTVALFNHDCYPGVARYFVGTKIVIQSLRPLQEGEVVAENYGPMFGKKPHAVRQRTLQSRYWFQCQCQACREDWPLFEHHSNSSFRLRCTTEGCKQLFPLANQNIKQKHKCRSCKKQISFEEQMRTLEECEVDYANGLDAMDEGDTAKAIPLFCSYIDRMHAIGCPPHKDLHLCQEALRICVTDSGNKWILSDTQNK